MKFLINFSVYFIKRAGTKNLIEACHEHTTEIVCTSAMGIRIPGPILRLECVPIGPSVIKDMIEISDIIYGQPSISNMRRDGAHRDAELPHCIGVAADDGRRARVARNGISDR